MYRACEVPALIVRQMCFVRIRPPRPMRALHAFMASGLSLVPHRRPVNSANGSIRNHDEAKQNDHRRQVVSQIYDENIATGEDHPDQSLTLTSTQSSTLPLRKANAHDGRCLWLVTLPPHFQNH